jgi:hypothetical protein
MKICVSLWQNIYSFTNGKDNIEMRVVGLGRARANLIWLDY